jgi:hypothetical protein
MESDSNEISPFSGGVAEIREKKRFFFVFNVPYPVAVKKFSFFLETTIETPKFPSNV